jgi:hypothetical protein
MTHRSLPALVALSLVLPACMAPPRTPSQIPPPPAATAGSGQLELALASGTYGCELGVRIQVEREMRDRVNHRIRLGWNGQNYRLERDPSYSGLPRFEDRASGLVWIDMPSKGLLLDGRGNRPLANECRPV